MAKKTLGYVELEWTCPSCQARNAGSNKTCKNCGAAMPENAQFSAPAGQQIDTSAETKARVAAGPDINCPYCGTRNPANASKCSQCGGDLTGGQRRTAGAVLGALRTEAGPPLTCPNCGASNPATATKCAQCGGVLGKSPEPSATQATSPSPRKPGCLLGFILVAIAAVIGLVIFLSSGGKEATATVQGVAWTYRVAIEELEPVQYESWHDELPSDARNLQCSDKVRETVSEPVAGATEVCGTPYVVDTGTGQGEVVQDCVYQVTDEWCRYTVDEWRAAGQEAVATGADMNPAWPEVSLGVYQRAGAYTEEYVVVLLADDQEYRYAPSSLEEFREFTEGSEWTIKTNRLGGVTEIDPK